MRPIKISRNSLSFVALVFSAMVVIPQMPAFAGPKPSVPEGWRRATASDVNRGHTIESRKNTPNLALEISGDFDGDGKEDTAYLAVNEAKHEFGVFMKLAAGGGDQLVVTDPISDLPNTGLRLAKRGQYQRDCNKDNLSPDCPNDLYINNDGIVLYQFGEPGTIYYITDDGIMSEDFEWIQ